MIGCRKVTLSPVVMTLAINFDLGKKPSQLREVFGLQVAIHDWFSAFFRYTRQDKVYILVSESQVVDDIRRLAHSVGFDEERLIPLDRRFVQENFTKFSLIFRPDPDAKQLFWQRQNIPAPGYAFCGLAHAISGLETGELLEQYCLAPSDHSDAIVCPSRAVQAAIRRFWDLYEDYLKVRFQTQYRCQVNLPIIPLGIHTERFATITSADRRTDQRNKLGLKEEDVVLLWVGRLSHAIKAHPLAMFLAAERAAEKTGASVHLVMYGYYVPEEAEPQFVKLAADICTKAKVTFISNKDPRFPDGVWAAGDIFLSLIDNIQESFGLTPIEAMAAGLPRVISDWNGYRDSVDDGKDGFLIPTTQPPAGCGDALSALLLSGREMYGGFLAKTALSTAVDHHAAAEALALLIQDKDRRLSMAAKARMRVQDQYDWKHIIPRYEDLWLNLAARRQGEQGDRPHYPSVLPQCPDPFTMYASYASSPLKTEDRFYTAATPDVIKRLWAHDINTFGLDMMITPDDMTRVINFVTQKKGAQLADILAAFAQDDHATLMRSLGWLLKLGILSRTVGAV